MKTWLAQQKEQSQRMLQLLNLVEREGYTLIDPPYFVDYDAFRARNEHFDQRQSIKLSNPGGRLLVLRPDLTTSVMERLQWHASDGALKVCYYASTFVQDKERFEAQREFGIEFFNAPKHEGETTIFKTLSNLLHTLDIEVTIECSHAAFMKTLFALLHLSREQTTYLRTLLKHKQADRLATFVKTLDQHPHQALIAQLLTLEGSLEDVRQTLQSLGYDALFAEPLRECETLVKASDFPIVIDFTLLSDLEYYAGVMFKAYRTIDAEPFIKGGRYDVAGLDGQAVGFSFAMARLMEEDSHG